MMPTADSISPSGSKPARRLPWFGWLGFVGLAAGEALLLGGNAWVATWFTPWMWTAYILAADALVAWRTGTSWLTTRRRELPLLILCSVGVWLVFEAYNFYLANWIYVNVPGHAGVRFLAFFWSFATIMPGVFVTADLVGCFRPTHDPDPIPRVGAASPASAFAFLIGLALVTIPLALPRPIAAYLFAFVWVGFIPLVESLNLHLGIPSPFAEWRKGSRTTVARLLVAGFICGLLWEAWNYQAFTQDGAYWIYTIPSALRVFGLHYGQMPLLGLGGFPPFALELASMYAFLRHMLGGTRVFGPPSA